MFLLLGKFQTNRTRGCRVKILLTTQKELPYKAGLDQRSFPMVYIILLFW